MNVVYRGGETLAEVVRSGFVEGFHRGSLVVLDAGGNVSAQVGDIQAPVFPRSANKPMQSVGALRAGLDFPDSADLALGSASHRGEPFHVAAVRNVLLRNGLEPDDLQCPIEMPIDPQAHDAVVAAGGGATRLLMNCSGKHAAMLVTCRTAGWSTEDYLDPDHPLQKANRQAVTDLTGYDVAATGVDGCGAPLFAFPLIGLAKAFQHLVEAEPGSHERTVADAMREHPEFVSGTRGVDTLLMKAVPGLLAKGGAEGVAALAVPGVGAIALKIDDGAHRAATVTSVAALGTLDLSGLDIDQTTLRKLSEATLYGGGQPVGAVRPLWPAA